MFEFSLSRAIIRSKYTIILTIGAVIGVTCLIVITSLFNNYYLTSENVFMGIHPHIRVQKEGMSVEESKNLAREIKEKFPGIADTAPALYKKVKAVISRVNKKKFFCVLENGKYVCFDETRHTGDVKLIPRYGFTIIENKEQIVLLKGIHVENNETISGIKKIINGSTRLNDLNFNVDENNNTLPWSFYLQQDLFPGTVGLKDFLIRFPEIGAQPYHLLQKGTLSMGTQKEENPLLVMSLQNAQECLGLKNTANTIEIRLKDHYQAEDLSERVKLFLGNDYQVESWIDHSRASFAFLRIIKAMILSIIFSISIVAAIGMISTLTLIVMQNRGKIAILKSMGIKSSSIYKIFILNTGLTGVIGVAAGTLLGWGASHFFIQHFGDSLKKLGIKNPQILLEPGEVILIGALVIVLFILTAIIPSRRAIAADVVDGLQEQ
ncbi:MAG: FtsX-like permease family protein [Candidatus Aminicenantes bacterium]|nr:FtsX-like permease family protein [Candidatus Aminicenantes bacterium]